MNGKEAEKECKEGGGKEMERRRQDQEDRLTETGTKTTIAYPHTDNASTNLHPLTPALPPSPSPDPPNRPSFPLLPELLDRANHFAVAHIRAGKAKPYV
jgi:hypothetical protein